MKYSNLIIFIAVLMWFSSCRKYCNSVVLAGVEFNYYGTLTDSSATIITCKKATNFSVVVDSIQEKIRVYIAPSGLSAGLAEIDCVFSNTSVDYEIILHPSGKVHKISNIRYGHEKIRGGYSKDYTVCSYAYTLDGTDISHGTQMQNGNVPGVTGRAIIIN